MLRRTKLIIAIFLGGAALAFLYLNQEVHHPPGAFKDAPNPVIKVGLKAPNILLSDLKGEKRGLEQFQGKVLLINFWATWCPPCLIEMPSLAAVYNKFSKQGFEILAINLDENPKSARQFVEKNRLPFTVLLDPDGSAAQQYLVYGLPYTVILDREGKIRFKIFGSHEWDRGEAVEKIKALL